MSPPVFRGPLWALVLLLGPVALARPSTDVDIGSGGMPTLSGSVTGQVMVASSTLNSDLSVTVDLGEVGPANRNAVVRVSVPIIIRSNRPYAVLASLTDVSGGGGPLGLRLSDIGFGVQNLRPLGHGRDCSNHTLWPPFHNDPALTVSRTGRASFPSSLGGVGIASVLLSGPELSRNSNLNPRRADNGWTFDAVFAVVPQFFEPGTRHFTVTFVIVPLPQSISCS